MAAELATALVGAWAVPDGACGREESFIELFPIIGDKESQEAVRAKTPAARHCQLLAAHPSACLHCDLKENPYKNKAAAKLAAMRHAELIIDAMDLYRDYDIGLITDLGSLTPEEVQAIRVVKHQERLNLIRIQSEAIAALLKG